MAEFNISELFQQAQQLQEKLKSVQDEAARKTVEAESGGGMVKVDRRRLDAHPPHHRRALAARRE